MAKAKKKKKLAKKKAVKKKKKIIKKSAPKTQRKPSETIEELSREAPSLPVRSPTIQEIAEEIKK
ncbi:MAG: hypothetical protein AB1467_05085 [Candidatus Diapherotrites archaeon]